MIRVFSGFIFGVWLAQNYSLPDIGKEIDNLQKKYRSRDSSDKSNK